MKYTYGPVPSRRLGVSLGVDLVPRKVCSYDCIYCQIGATTLQTTERREYIPAASILEDVRATLEDWNREVEYVSISGSGEPTLNVKLGEIIGAIKDMTSVPVAVVTNGSLLWVEQVRRDLRDADVVLPSLDAATPSVFEVVNRPCSSLSAETVLQGLVDFRREYSGQLWLELLLCRGVNDDWAEVEKLIAAVNKIEPDKIHLNTVVRPAVEDYAYLVPMRRMEQVKKKFGEKAEIITDFAGHNHRIPSRNVADRVLHLIERRPVTPEDLSSTLGIHDLELVKILEKLTREGRVAYRVFNKRLYYELPQGVKGREGSRSPHSTMSVKNP